MLNKKGVVSIAIVYSFLLVFVVLVAGLILNYTNNRITTQKIYSKIKESLTFPETGDSTLIQQGDNNVFFGSLISRDEIEEIEFVDYVLDIENIPEDVIDQDSGAVEQKYMYISTGDDNGIMLWFTQLSSYNYKAYIGSERKILAPNNSAYLFANLPYLTSIKFYENFDTSNITNMNYMFANSGTTAIEGVTDQPDLELNLGILFSIQRTTTENMFVNTGNRGTGFTINTLNPATKDYLTTNRSALGIRSDAVIN